MTVTIYRAGIGGAPNSFNNAAGAFIAVLDFCLVTGQGWTKTSLGTNQASYQAPSGVKRFLQVDDSNAGFAQCTAWETLTALNTGTNRFPSATVVYVDHSNSASNQAWRLITNGTIFHFMQQWDGSHYEFFTFGDFISYKPTDAYNAMIAGQYSQGSTSNIGWGGSIVPFYNSASGGANQIAINRANDQTTVAPACAIFSNTGQLQNNNGNPNTVYPAGNGASVHMAYPYVDLLAGALDVAPFYIGESAGIRGIIPGVWQFLGAYGFNDGDKIPALASTGIMANRTFEVVNNPGSLLIETSNTWGGY